MQVMKKVASIIISLILGVIASLSFIPASAAWGEWYEVPSEDVDVPMDPSSQGEFVGPILLSADEQLDNQEYVPPAGWEVENGIEWMVDEGECLHIRPRGDLELGLLNGDETKVIRNKSEYTSISFSGRIKVGEYAFGDHFRAPFRGDTHLESVRGLGSLDLSDCGVPGWKAETGLNHMFAGCTSLTSIDFSGFDTSVVTSMSFMFYGCSSLASVDFSGLDTSAVTNMSNIFEGCSSLTSVNLSGLDTSAVTSMYWMFCGCTSLETLDLSGLDTSAVTNMENMFTGCSSLESIDLSGLNTAAVRHMWSMFRGCSSLASVDLSSFDTSAATWASNTRIESVFDDCPSLKAITVGEKCTLQEGFPYDRWRNSQGDWFVPKEIPVGVADTYVRAVHITDVTIEQASPILMDYGGSLQLSVSVEPTDNDDQMWWQSSDPGVADVDEVTGLVTAHAPGVATIGVIVFDLYGGTFMDEIEVIVKERPARIALSETAKVVKLSDGPFTLTATIISPGGGGPGADDGGSSSSPFVWSSSDARVATVDANGKVTPKQVGTTSITVSAAGMSAECLLTVIESDEDIVPVDSVALDRNVASITGKGSMKLSATATPSNATYRAIRWSSSNENVAVVDPDGTVTSQGKGTATITATSLDGKASASCQVTVLNPPTSLKLDVPSSQVKIGQTTKIALMCSGDLPGATESMETIEWLLSDHGVASLASSDADAAVTGVSVGKATLTVVTSYAGNRFTADADLEVIWADPESITLSEEEMQVVVDADPFMLSASVAPESAAGTKVEWRSFTPQVASVDQNGTVTVHRVGRTEIIVRAGAVTTSCGLRVVPKSVATSDDSDVEGALRINDSETAAYVGDAHLRIKDSAERSNQAMVQLAVGSAGGISAMLDAYDVDLVDEEGVVVPLDEASDAVTVLVKMDDPTKAVADTHDLGVHYIDLVNGKTEAKSTWVEEEMLAFETTHFSTYAITATQRPQEPVSDPVRDDTTVGGGLAKTGDALGAALDGAAAIALLGMISLAIVSVLRRHKDRQQRS